MSLTPEYQRQLKEVHSGRRPDKLWGTTGGRNIGPEIVRFLEQRRAQITTVLDFGAGQRRLEKYVKDKAIDVNVRWTNYDPGIAGIDTLPEESFDLVVSSDVLEHVEPEETESTIQWMRDHAKKAMYHHVACDPCGLTLPDGRNAHLVTEGMDWWRDKFEHRDWVLMYSADCQQRKRGGLRHHILLQYDKC